jgi:hypothetical protein
VVVYLALEGGLSVIGSGNGSSSLGRVIFANTDLWFIALAEDGRCCVRPILYSEDQAAAWEAFLRYYRVILPELKPSPPTTQSVIILDDSTVVHF